MEKAGKICINKTISILGIVTAFVVGFVALTNYVSNTTLKTNSRAAEISSAKQPLQKKPLCIKSVDEGGYGGVCLMEAFYPSCDVFEFNMGTPFELGVSKENSSYGSKTTGYTFCNFEDSICCVPVKNPCNKGMYIQGLDVKGNVRSVWGFTGEYKLDGIHERVCETYQLGLDYPFGSSNGVVPNPPVYSFKETDFACNSALKIHITSSNDSTNDWIVTLNGKKNNRGCFFDFSY